MAHKPAETPSIGLGSMLRQEKFQVPNHQRDYSWTQDEVGQLFNDIEAAIERDDDNYFLGLMVCLIQGDGTFILLDGQQRLATTIIFLSAVRAWLKQVESSADDARQIRDDFIGRRELGEANATPKLNLNAENNPFFQKYVVNDTPIESVRSHLKSLRRTDRNYNLLNSIDICHKRVAVIVDRFTSPADAARELIRIVKYISEDVRIVRFDVKDDSAAYTIFETLNDRGLDLTTIDLVKNHLFSRVPSKSIVKLSDLENRWTQMMGVLSEVKANDFLKAYWTSRHGRIQKDNLFKSIKSDCSDANSAINLSIELNVVADQYAALFVSDDSIWSQYNEETKETIGALKILGATQTYPIILAALDKFSDREFERIVKLLEVIIVRYQLICMERTGVLEIQCARVAKAIFDKQISTATEARDLLKDVYPDDETFHKAFSLKVEPTTEKARYLLSKLEVEERTRASKDGARVSDPGIGLTIEHILPKKPGSGWDAVVQSDPTFHDECLYRLANQCLLGKSNRALGNKGFDEKKPAYAKVDVLTTNHVGTLSAWSRKELNDVQLRMASRAVHVWRFG